MPRINIPNQTRLPSGRTGSNVVADSLARGQFAGEQAISQGLSDISRVAEEFAVRRQKARDHDAITDGQNAYTQAYMALGEDFRNRNDYENFEKEIDETNKRLGEQILANPQLSSRGKQLLKQDFEHASAVSKLKLGAIAGKKERAVMRSKSDSKLKTLEKNQDLEGALELIHGDYANNIIDVDERDARLESVEQNVLFYNRKEQIEITPEHYKTIARDPKLIEANKKNLLAYGERLEADRQNNILNFAETVMKQAMETGDYNIETIIEHFDQAKAESLSRSGELRLQSMRNIITNHDRARQEQAKNIIKEQTAEEKKRVDNLNKLSGDFEESWLRDTERYLILGKAPNENGEIEAYGPDNALFDLASIDISQPGNRSLYNTVLRQIEAVRESKKGDESKAIDERTKQIDDAKKTAYTEINTQLGKFRKLLRDKFQKDISTANDGVTALKFLRFINPGLALLDKITTDNTESQALLAEYNERQKPFIDLQKNVGQWIIDQKEPPTDLDVQNYVREQLDGPIMEMHNAGIMKAVKDQLK